MSTLIIISLAILATYILTLVYKHGVPTSLSDTYYVLEHKKKGSGRIFVLIMFCTTMLLIGPMIELTPENWKFIAFLAVIGLGFVGAAPMFLEKSTSKVHYIAASVSAIGGLAWIFMAAPHCWPIIPATIALTLIAATYTKSLKCYVFWAEMAVFSSVYSAALIVAL